MEELVWRLRAKYTAFLNMIVECVGFLVTSFNLFSNMAIKDETIRFDGSSEKTEPVSSLVVRLALFMATSILSATQMGATVSLIKATWKKQEADKVLEGVTIWKVTSGFLLTPLTLECCLLMLSASTFGWFGLFWLLWHIIASIIVYELTTEVELILNNNNTNYPVNVLIAMRRLP